MTTSGLLIVNPGFTAAAAAAADPVPPSSATMGLVAGPGWTEPSAMYIGCVVASMITLQVASNYRQTGPVSGPRFRTLIV